MIYIDIISLIGTNINTKSLKCAMIPNILCILDTLRLLYQISNNNETNPSCMETKITITNSKLAGKGDGEIKLR